MPVSDFKYDKRKKNLVSLNKYKQCPIYFSKTQGICVKESLWHHSHAFKKHWGPQKFEKLERPGAGRQEWGNQVIAQTPIPEKRPFPSAGITGNLGGH